MRSFPIGYHRITGQLPPSRARVSRHTPVKTNPVTTFPETTNRHDTPKRPTPRSYQGVISERSGVVPGGPARGSCQGLREDRPDAVFSENTSSVTTDLKRPTNHREDPLRRPLEKTVLEKTVTDRTRAVYRSLRLVCGVKSECIRRVRRADELNVRQEPSTDPRACRLLRQCGCVWHSERVPAPGWHR